MNRQASKLIKKLALRESKNTDEFFKLITSFKKFYKTLSWQAKTKFLAEIKSL